MRKVELPLPKKNNPVINAYNEAVQRGLASYYIIPIKQKWVVRKGLDEILKSFSDKSKAIDFAKQSPLSAGASIFLYAKTAGVKRLV